MEPTTRIDWTEARATAWHALKVAIVITYLAGRLTRRAWDALPVLSERLGRWYATALVGPAPVAPVAPVLPVLSVAPLPVALPAVALQPVPIALESLTCRELRDLTGTRRKLSKRQLIAIAQGAA